MRPNMLHAGLAAIIFTFASILASAEGRPRTLSEYFKSATRAGDVTCEAVQKTCYLTVSASRILTEQDDPTNMLRKGALHEAQRQFTRVTVDQILVELDRGKAKLSTPVDIYLKVDWEARDNGPLALRFQRKHIVHGRLVVGEGGAFEFKVLNLPDMVIIGMFNPSLEVAQVFGRQIGRDNLDIETDLKVWLEAVLTAVIPQAIGLSQSLP